MANNMHFTACSLVSSYFERYTYDNFNLEDNFNNLKEAEQEFWNSQFAKHIFDKYHFRDNLMKNQG